MILLEQNQLHALLSCDYGKFSIESCGLSPIPFLVIKSHMKQARNVFQAIMAMLYICDVLCFIP